MTQEEKDILLEKMLDPEGVLTDAELEMILRDDELKDIYEMSSSVKGACIQPSKIDVKQEWRLFRHRIRPRPSRWRWMMRVAAIFLGVLFVSAIVKIAIDRLLSEEKPVVVVNSKGSVVKKHFEETPSPTTIPIAENEDLSSTPEAKPKASTHRQAISEKAIKDEEIDVDEYLRLQQAMIDNEMALIQAELYIAELQALEETKIPSDEENSLEQNELRYVIMQ